MTALRAGPAQAVAYLASRLRPVPGLEPGTSTRLLADLDAEDFATREGAQRELASLGEAAEGALRRARAANPSAEAGRRLDTLLKRLEDAEGRAPSSAVVGGRALEALERMGTPEARRVVEEVAKGAPQAELTREAKAARERLGRRQEP